MPAGGNPLALEQPHHIGYAGSHRRVFDALDTVGQRLDRSPLEIFRHRRAAVTEPGHWAEGIISVLRPEVERAHGAQHGVHPLLGPRCSPSRVFTASLNSRTAL